MLLVGSSSMRRRSRVLLQIRFGIRAGRIHGPTRGARGAQGRFHQLRGDAPAADCRRNSGVGNGHDPIGQRVVEFGAAPVHLRGEPVRVCGVADGAHYLSALRRMLCGPRCLRPGFGSRRRALPRRLSLLRRTPLFNRRPVLLLNRGTLLLDRGPVLLLNRGTLLLDRGPVLLLNRGTLLLLNRGTLLLDRRPILLLDGGALRRSLRLRSGRTGRG